MWVSGVLFSGWGVLVFVLRRAGVRPARLRAGLLLGGVAVAAGAAIAGVGVDLMATSDLEIGRVPSGVFSPRVNALALTAAVAAMPPGCRK